MVVEAIMIPDWMTPDEVAGIFKVHTRTILRMCSKHRLPAIRVGDHWRISGPGLHAQALLNLHPGSPAEGPAPQKDNQSPG